MTTLNWQNQPSVEEIEEWVDGQYARGNKLNTNFRQIQGMETAIIFYHRAIRETAAFERGEQSRKPVISQKFVDMVVNGDDDSAMAFIAQLSK